MLSSNTVTKVKDLFYIVLGVSLLSIAINIFYAPNDIVVGGFTGVGIIVESVTDETIPIATTNLALNIPLFAVALYMRGKKYLRKTILATALFSLALEVGTLLPTYTGDFTLVAVFGGIIDGLGVGFVLRGMASTGGVDLLASLVHSKLRHISLSKIMLVINTIIIAGGFFVFGAEKAMYGIISIFISSRCITMVLEGLAFSKAAFIISAESAKISQEIFAQLGRGVTALEGKGMYTREKKEVLLCVFSQKEIKILKDAVRKVDPCAFLIVTDVKEVLGEGFKSFDINE